MTKPVFLELLENVTVVPALTQKAVLALASGILGLAVAELLPLRLISMLQGEDAEPQVLASAQIFAGLATEQTSFLTFFLVSWPTMNVVRKSGKTKRNEKAAR
jgi:hypothetical protein